MSVDGYRFAQVSTTILSDPSYGPVWAERLGQDWLLCYVVADDTWPRPAYLPAPADLANVARLAELGHLVLDGPRFTMPAVDERRQARKAKAAKGGNARAEGAARDAAGVFVTGSDPANAGHQPANAGPASPCDAGQPTPTSASQRTLVSQPANARHVQQTLVGASSDIQPRARVAEQSRAEKDAQEDGERAKPVDARDDDVDDGHPRLEDGTMPLAGQVDRGAPVTIENLFDVWPEEEFTPESVALARAVIDGTQALPTADSFDQGWLTPEARR